MSLLALFRPEPDPLHDPGAAASFASGLPQDDPLRALDSLGEMLRSLAAATVRARVRVEIAAILERAGAAPEREVLEKYREDPRLRNAAATVAWSAAYRYRSALAEVRERCALEQLPSRPASPSSRGELAAIAAGALRARVAHLRLAMLHYEPVPQAAWKALYATYARCESAGIASTPAQARLDDLPHTTPLMELMRGLLVAIAAPERLPPEEVDAAFIIAQRFAGAARLEHARFAGATHALDLSRGAAPAPIGAGTPPGAAVRYLGARDALANLEGQVGFQADAMLDEDNRLAAQYSPGQRVTVLRQFMHYWSGAGPRPARALVRLPGDVSVVHGFADVCHYAPHIAAVAAAKRTPGMPAQALGVEEDFAFAPPEHWPGREAGLDVLRVEIPPSAGAWVEVGDLAALQAGERADWWLGAVRRLEPAAHGALRAELEILARRPVSVWLRVLGRADRSVANWQSASGTFAFEYTQALVITERSADSRGPSLVLPKGRFVPEQLVELLHGERSRALRFGEFLEQGRDYDRCTFSWQ